MRPRDSPDLRILPTSEHLVLVEQNYIAYENSLGSDVVEHKSLELVKVLKIVKEDHLKIRIL